MSVEVSKETDLFSQRAEIFRAQLISDFHLLESISDQGSRKGIPNLYTADITDPVRCRRIMLNRPQGLVRFHIYSQDSHKKKTVAQRRRNRLVSRQKKRLPLDVWANFVVSSTLFQNSILCLILFNSIVLGIQAEISDIPVKSPALRKLILALDILDYMALICFVIEIFLKWIVNFKEFWKNRWNIFDFLVTFMSLIPEIIKYSSVDTFTGISSNFTVIAENLRTFRVMRTLKMVSRFQKVRLIVLSVTKAFQEMIFIILLLSIFAYIFAIIGVIFIKYEDTEGVYTYKDAFSSFPQCLVTLFQLFTLDHWMDVYKDVTMATGQLFAASYIILWIIIGSFIIRNIVVGIMVNNFQSIRNELFHEVDEIKKREKRDLEMAEFAEELDRQNQKKLENHQPSFHKKDVAPKRTPLLETGSEETDSAFRLHNTASQFISKEELRDAMDHNVNKMEQESEAWQRIVESNLENLSKENTPFCWPQDSLFKYYTMLENLQENIAERQEIISMAGHCISLLQDK